MEADAILAVRMMANSGRIITVFPKVKKFNKKETFKTEIGPQSIPTLESIQGMMPEKDWTSITDAWAEHNFISGGGRNLMKTMTKRYGKVVNVAVLSVNHK